MSSPLRAAMATLQDARRTHTAAATRAQAQWTDAAQRAFWDRIISQIDREASQYQTALTALDEQLRKALQRLDS